MKNKLYQLLMLTFLMPFLSHAQWDEAAGKADVLMNELLATYPGLSVAVGYGDEIIWKKGYGFADAENKIIVTPEHQFRMYSLSKSITGMALIKLVEEGKLDIEKPVTDYLSDLPEFYEQVKVKHLINHTAGIRHYNKGEWLKISSDDCKTAAEAIQVFVSDPLETTPGEIQSYSSFGYVLLSHLVASISGKTFNSYVKETFLDPLEITTLAPDQSEMLTNEVAYYQKWKGSKNKGKKAIVVNNSCKFGGGGFVGTAEAVVKLHLAMVNGEFVSEESLEKYYTQIPDDKGESSGYAFGIGDSMSKSGMRYHSHTGSAVGANAVLVVYRKSDRNPVPIVAVIMGNMKEPTMNSNVGKLAGYFREELKLDGN